HKKQITGNEALSLRFDFVYVHDSVLDKYERNDETYIVSPENCSVWYGNQWAVICNGRVDRHTIEVELKNLYEGVRYDITKHWNKYAVKDPVKYEKGIDIGSKSKKLLEDYVKFGEYLAYQLGIILEEDITPEQITNINEHNFYKGYWWDQEQIKPITYHIPHNFNQNDFFNRCSLLSKLIIEPLPEKIIRKTLKKLNIYNDSIKSYRSLRLLNFLLRYFFFAQKIGFDLMNNNDIETMKKRIENDFKDNPIEPLILLQKFRKLDAHNISSQEKMQIINEGNKIFHIQTVFN
ncbi:unnamed protein product, partial [marine sediment metagenome]